jgi:hypothetical protein
VIASQGVLFLHLFILIPVAVLGGYGLRSLAELFHDHRNRSDGE